MNFSDFGQYVETLKSKNSSNKADEFFMKGLDLKNYG